MVGHLLRSLTEENSPEAHVLTKVQVDILTVIIITTAKRLVGGQVQIYILNITTTTASEYHVSPDSLRLLDHSGSGKVQPSPLPS